MIGSIILAIIGGLIIGVLARLVLPGKQNISMVMTIVIGVVSSFIASIICNVVFHYDGNGGIRWIPLIVGVIVAAVLIGMYSNHKSRNTLTR